MTTCLGDLYHTSRHDVMVLRFSLKSKLTHHLLYACDHFVVADREREAQAKIAYQSDKTRPESAISK
jgi:hypothetical protein